MLSTCTSEYHITVKLSSVDESQNLILSENRQNADD